MQETECSTPTAGYSSGATKNVVIPSEAGDLCRPAPAVVAVWRRREKSVLDLGNQSEVAIEERFLTR